MLEIASSNGTTHIVLTPHYLTNDHSFKKFNKQALESRFESFSLEAKQMYPELNLYLGAETVAVSNFRDVLAEEQLITINNSRYVLLEFGFDDRFERALRVTDKILSLDFVPIVAHPERYHFIQRNPELLMELRSYGALLQLNSTSLFGLSGDKAQRIAFEALENRAAQFIASDSHSVHMRNPNLAECYMTVASGFGQQMAEELFYINPLAVINDEYLG